MRGFGHGTAELILSARIVNAVMALLRMPSGFATAEDAVNDVTDGVSIAFIAKCRLGFLSLSSKGLDENLAIVSPHALFRDSRTF
jgi:hypothetical protein